MKRQVFILFSGLLLGSLSLYGQDLGNLKNQKPLTLSGGVGAGSNFYTSNEAYKSRDPFNWNLHGNLTANLYGVALPFSFVVSQYSSSYSAPFSQFGISPSYKWATVHLGYRSMSLSPLVFDGQSFLGAGVELHPGKFSFAGFYGRLNKAVSEDTTYDHRIEPQYSRIGYGFKIGFDHNGNRIQLNAFHAADKENSIPTLLDSLNTLRPQANTVLGGSWNYRFFGVLSFDGDLAFSLLNRDQHYAPLDSIGHYEVPQFIRTISPVNNSSVFSYSGRTHIGLNLQGVNLMAGYQRIQPDYLSLGTPYTVNDVETFQANAGTTLLKGHVHIQASGNSQHNNLSKALVTELHSRSGNLNINANIQSNILINMNVNAAHVFQKDGTLKLNDSLRMNQLMLNYSLSPSYILTSATRQQTINANFSYTNLDDRNPVTSAQAAGNNINLSGNYALQFIQSYVGANAGVTYSVYGQEDFRYQSTGINVGGNVQLLKDHQLGIQGNIGYFLNRSKGATVGNNTSFSLNSSYSANKHSFSLYSSYIITPPVNLNPLDKVNRVPSAVNSRNFSAGISYGYQF